MPLLLVKKVLESRKNKHATFQKPETVQSSTSYILWYTTVYWTLLNVFQPYGNKNKTQNHPRNTRLGRSPITVVAAAGHIHLWTRRFSRIVRWRGSRYCVCAVHFHHPPARRRRKSLPVQNNLFEPHRMFVVSSKAYLEIVLCVCGGFK